MSEGCLQVERLDPAKLCYLQSTTKVKSIMLCKNVQWLKVTENSAYARHPGKVTGCSLFFPKGAEMRQAVRKVRRSDTQETTMAEQFFGI